MSFREFVSFTQHVLCVLGASVFQSFLSPIFLSIIGTTDFTEITDGTTKHTKYMKIAS